MTCIRRSVGGLSALVGVMSLVALTADPVVAQPASIKVGAIPALVECGGEACVRVLLNAYDAKGEPVPVGETAAFEIVEAGKSPQNWWQYKLIETLKGSATQQGSTPRFALLVVDTSGSMLEPVLGGSGTKFDAARAAIQSSFLANFQPGTDHMAIVGFDSRRVRARIEGSDFETTKSAVQAQLDALAPSKQGNTALYSATDYALEKLTSLTRSGRTKGAQVQLVVFTDGKNDVNASKGDDAGLLDGPESLSIVEQRAREATKAINQSGVVSFEVITIGLGKAGQTYDPEALRRLAYPEDDAHTFNAENQASLERLFRVARIAQLNRVFLTFGPVRSSKDQITTPLSFTIAMTGAGAPLSTVTPRYEPPPLGLPSWDGELTQNEYLDFIKWTGRETTGSPKSIGLPGWLMRLIVLATFSLTLAVLWFGLPRLIWPERYVPRPSFQVAPSPGGRAARPAAGRQVPQKGVTIAGRAVVPQRPAAGPPTQSPSRLRDPGPQRPPAPGPAVPPPVPRARNVPPGSPQRPAREPFVRGAGDATVFVPPDHNPGDGDS